MLNKWKNQQFFLEPSEKRGHRVNFYPPNCRDRQADTENHNLPERKQASRHLRRKQCQGRKNRNCNWCTAGGSVRTTLRVKTPGGEGVPHAFVSFTSWRWTRFSQRAYQRKILLWFQQGEEKCNPLEIQPNILFFATRPALQRNSFTTVLSTGVLSEANWPGGREIANFSSQVAIPSRLRGWGVGGGLSGTCEFHRPGPRAH